jgi:hypothetical protein
MRRFFGIALLAVGLAAVPALSHADPIGVNGCGGEVFACDLFADYGTTGASELGAAAGNLGGYLVAYTLLLNQAADISDGVQVGDVAHILVIHDSLFQLFSNNNLVGSLFGSIFTAATSLSAIDGVGLAAGQVVGCPEIPNGVPSLGGVGLCGTADVVSLVVNWGFADGSAGADILNIHTAFDVNEEPPPPPPPTGVPEPGTLSLVGIGFGSLLLRHRRKA